MPRGQKADIGSTRVAPNGYHYTKVADFEWALTHHLVMQEKLGRMLRANERVHFVDGDRTNLDPDNLDIKETKGGKEKKIESLRQKIAALQAQLENLLDEG